MDNFIVSILLHEPFDAQEKETGWQAISLLRIQP